MNQIAIWQWALVITTSIFFLVFSPFAKKKKQFFKAVQNKRAPSMQVLTGSLIISWIFAKSITVAADLGASFGFVGGLAYASYYLSFAIAGIIIYQLRTKGNFLSIHHYLEYKFGQPAIVLFSILISIRLFNEVWSNTMVIGSYFGQPNTTAYYTAICLFTFLTLVYVLKGGLSSSIFTDVIQMFLFAILLCIILWYVFSFENISFAKVVSTGTWSFDFGLDLLFVALLQSFSYPFHDPVLTDRGFISSPKTTLKSFLWASFFGIICILLFSFVGVFARLQGLSGSSAAILFAKFFGTFVLLIVNFIMITSAASTLDSTFSSAAKLFALDLKLGNTVRFGRGIMIAFAILGTIPVFFNAQILSATTISGTMVIGLTPIFIFWKQNTNYWSFFLSVICGLVFGFLLLFDVFPEIFIFTSGNYATLLWVNIWGILCCCLFYMLPIWLKKLKS